MLTRTLDTLRERAENITDTRIMGIVLAFLAGALVVSLGSAAGLTVAEGGNWLHNTLAWLDGFAQNFGTEMIGAAITFVLLEVMLARRRERDAEEREKARLILQMGSPDNAFAVEAARQIRMRGWLTDGSLTGIHIDQANLAGADLSGAKLVGVNMFGINLTAASLLVANLAKVQMHASSLAKANLEKTILSNSDLSGSNFQDADLFRADLTDTLLRGADLSHARLHETILIGADLCWANLEGSDLDNSVWDETTTLPDDTKWSASIDLRRFTDPEHPDFWRSDYLHSPAYRGEDEDKKADD